MKPGLALNRLVPQKKAMFFTDPACEDAQKEIDLVELKEKQDVRRLEIFLAKLKEIQIVF